MRISYTIRADSDYCRSVVEQYYRQLPLWLHLPVQFGVLGFIVGALYAWSNNNPLAGLLLGALVFAVGYLATWAGLMFRLRRGADFGQEFTVIVSEDGLEARGNHVHSTWEWGAYPRAIRFPDGILLLRKGVIRWLPDAAIREGSAEQITSLVASKSALRYVA